MESLWMLWLRGRSPTPPWLPPSLSLSPSLSASSLLYSHVLCKQHSRIWVLLASTIAYSMTHLHMETQLQTRLRLHHSKYLVSPPLFFLRPVSCVLGRLYAYSILSVKGTANGIRRFCTSMPSERRDYWFKDCLQKQCFVSWHWRSTSPIRLCSRSSNDKVARHTCSLFTPRYQE